MLPLDANSVVLPGEVDERLPAPLIDAFLDRSSRVPVRKGEIVILEGTGARDVFLIRDGEMQVVLSSSSGREVILRHMRSGHIFGEMAAIDGGARSARVVAVSDGSLAVMSGAQFLNFLTEVSDAGLWMTRQMTARVRDLTEKTYALALLPTSTRIQAELLRLARRTPEFRDDAERIEIKQFPTHAEIAARTGTHREGVSREFGLLAKEGIIEQKGRTMVVCSLPDLRALYERIGH